jgi:hypothetical protein
MMLHAVQLFFMSQTNIPIKLPMHFSLFCGAVDRFSQLSPTSPKIKSKWFNGHLKQKFKARYKTTLLFKWWCMSYVCIPDDIL